MISAIAAGLMLFNFLTSGQGSFWTKLNGPLASNVYCLATGRGDILFAGTDHGIIRSTDIGAHWTVVGGISDSFQVRRLFVDNDGRIFADALVAIFASTDNGDSWQHVSGVEKFSTLVGINHRGHLYVRTPKQVLLYSPDRGLTWKKSTDQFVTSIVRGSGNFIFSCTDARSFYASTDDGGTWSRSSLPFQLSNPTISSITSSPSGRIYVGNEGGGLFFSNDFGKSWKHVALSRFNVRALAVDLRGNVFVAADSFTVLRTEFGKKGLFTLDSTLQSCVLSGLWGTSVTSAVIGRDSAIVVGTYGRGIWRSTDGGLTWGQAVSGFWYPHVSHICTPGKDEVWLTTPQYGFFRSTNQGASWQQIVSGLDDDDAIELTSEMPGHYVLATWNSGIHISTNNGTDWFRLKEQPEGIPLSVAATRTGSVLVGTHSEGIVLSNDLGKTWKQVGLQECEVADLLVLSDDIIVAGSEGITHYYASNIEETKEGRGVYISRNGGLNWKRVGLKDVRIMALSRGFARTVFAASASALFKSSDSGVTWVRTEFPSHDITCIAFDTSGFAIVGTSKNGVFFSKDNGKQWIALNPGLTELSILSVAISSDGFAYAATENHGVFRGFLKTLVR
jgi:photosystem II stability/assembly factor-like uncharacterized protein